LKLLPHERNMITKFRCNNIKLPIETGRWSNIPREERICHLWSPVLSKIDLIKFSHLNWTLSIILKLNIILYNIQLILLVSNFEISIFQKFTILNFIHISIGVLQKIEEYIDSNRVYNLNCLIHLYFQYLLMAVKYGVMRTPIN
jgi:hypothetical protein